MTRKFYILILVLLVLSCDDEISYDLVQPVAGLQKVLIEEISGVRCPNCPDGSRLLEALNEEFDSSLVVVTYHAGSFSIPYNDSKYDFKTNQSVALMELLGRPVGYPSAAIQRLPLEDKEGYQRFPNTWTSTISRALSVRPVVNLELSVRLVDSVSLVSISALFLEAISTPVYMTAYLIEDGLIDPQADIQSNDEYVPDFRHDHILREVLTPVSGIKWSDGFQALAFKEDSLKIGINSLPQVVNPERTSFVVFLHTKDGVLQVEKANSIP